MTALVRRALASARVRILLTLFLVLAFMAVLTTVLLRQVLTARATERVDDALTQEVAEFRTLVDKGIDPETGEAFGRDVQAMFDTFLERNVPGRGELIYTFLPGREYRSSPTELPAAVIARLVAIGSGATRTERGEIETADLRVRYLAVPVQAEGGDARGVFLIAGDLTGEEAEASDAADVAGYVAGVALVLATLLGLAVTRRTLRPLREMAATAQTISETDLARRIEIRSDDEIGQLGRTFNQMLDRLELAFDSQRALVSDVGHELRTPITIVRGHLDLLSGDATDQAVTIALVQDELDRMSRLVDDLLTLAKAERTDFLQARPLDLDDLTAELAAKLRGLGGDHVWRLRATGTGMLVGDRQRLTQAVMNLADNARRHTPPGTVVELATRLHGREARLSVSDAGPGIAAADQARLFGRFERGADARSGEGSGLGLAIVRAIAEAHGGRVELHSVPPHGATFTVVVPAEPVPEPEPQEVPA